MKKTLLSGLALLLSTFSFAQEALITGYVDAPCSGASGRVLEIYVNGTIDFTDWNLARQSNGDVDGYDFDIDISGLGTITDDFAYITNDQTVFEGEFGTVTHLIENNGINSNGNDAFQLVDNNMNVIDRFGEESVDGSGTDWDHLDSYYLRNDGAFANGGNFDASNWTFGAINELDGLGSCNGGDPLSELIALGSFTPATTVVPSISFEETYISVSEQDGTAILEITISEAPAADATIDVAIITEVTTAVASQNYDYTSETITFTPSGDLTQTITVDMLDNTDAEPDTLLALELLNAVNAELGDTTVSVIYILDDEMHAPDATEDLGTVFGASYEIEGDNPGSEIVAFDAETQRLFVMNSGNASVEILDISAPLAIQAIETIDLSAHGDAGTSVAVFNGIVAATAVPDDINQNGVVVFMDTDGNEIVTVEAGSLPDMITFSNDGSLLLVANEGEPNSDYTIDPEGTISVIDLSGGVENLTQGQVTTLDFNDFDALEDQLIAEGVRIFGPNASVSQDLEPEYITIAEDNTKAWVTLQENNAVAVVDLVAMEISEIIPLGYKDHMLPQNALDTSNEQDFIYMANWPIKGVYMPDAIASYTVDDVTYFVTANEGDAREYDAYEEEVSLEDIVLDGSVFSHQDFLRIEENLGKIGVTAASGDLDDNGIYEEIHVFGGRSFSIYNAETGVQVYDSGSDFERIIAEHPVYNAIFNATDDENEFKNRSDNKGPEPEAILVQEIEGNFYAFIALERVGGFMIYNISNPNNPVFEGYYNNRSTTPGDDIDGDLAPESIVYIAPSENSEEKGLIVIANEVSATISVYVLENNVLSTQEADAPTNNFVVYPNPSKGDYVFFTNPTDYILFDLSGRKIEEKEQATHINVSKLNSGTYLVKNGLGQVQKIVVK